MKVLVKNYWLEKSLNFSDINEKKNLNNKDILNIFSESYNGQQKHIQNYICSILRMYDIRSCNLFKIGDIEFDIYYIPYFKTFFILNDLQFFLNGISRKEFLEAINTLSYKFNLYYCNILLNSENVIKFEVQ